MVSSDYLNLFGQLLDLLLQQGEVALPRGREQLDLLLNPDSFTGPTTLVQFPRSFATELVEKRLFQVIRPLLRALGERVRRFFDHRLHLCGRDRLERVAR